MTRQLAKGQLGKERSDDRPTLDLNPLLRRVPKISVPLALLTSQLMEAATDGNLSKADLLIEEGADIDGKEIDWPPIVMAAVNKKTEMLLFLGERGANLEVKEKVSERTALHWAAANGFFECVVALVNLGAVTKVADDMKKTPRDLAVDNGHYQIAEFLEKVKV